MVIIIPIKEKPLSLLSFFLPQYEFLHLFPLRIFPVYQYAFHKSTWQVAKCIKAITFLNHLNSQTLNF